MKKILLSGIALTALLSSSALAADLAVKAPVYKAQPAFVPAFSWTGCYVGAHGGYGKTRTSHNVQFDDANAFPPEFLFTDNFSPSSGVVGLQAGCNYQTGMFVFGIEGDYTWVNASESRSFQEPGGADTASFTSKLENLATIRGRVGIAQDRALVYVTGGAAWAKFNYSFNLFDSDGGTNAASLSFTPNGFVVGLGAEYAVTDWFILRAEYLHYGFDKDYALPTSANPFIGPGLGDRVTFKTVDVFRVGASWKFGGWGGPVVAKY
jgi:outer membrane immunogenic protein